MILLQSKDDTENLVEMLCAEFDRLAHEGGGDRLLYVAAQTSLPGAWQEACCIAYYYWSMCGHDYWQDLPGPSMELHWHGTHSTALVPVGALLH